MKHKLLTVFLTLIAALCLCFGLAACGGIGGSGQSGSPHTHSFTDYVYNDDATCTEDGTETATCSCGETDTRIKKGTAGHKFTVENICSGCGDKWEFTDGLIYELDQETDTYTVAENADVTGDIVIPYGYQGKWVTSIGWGAFRGCSGLTSIEIPNSVTLIGQISFEDCSSLTSIEIPNSVIRIESEAFRGCHSLENIEIPDSVTSIGGLAFYDTAYYNNPSHWDEGVALYMCNRLIEVNNTIEGSYTIRTDTIRIETGAFYWCGGLTSVQIPESVTSIGYQAFGGCISLNSIVIPDSVTSIEATAFVFCEKLTNIKIPNGVTSIERSTFEYCSSLESVEIPDSVTSIGERAFRGCHSLENIEIPDSVTSIGGSAFNGCSSLENIEVAQGNSVYHSSGNCLIETESKILIWGCKTSQIPDDGSVTSIGKRAFWGCSELESIEIPDSVTSIGDEAFDGCSGLTSITIPDSVTSIGYFAFYGCSGLTSITIPDSVTSIGNYAFWACSSLTDIQFKGTVEEWQAIEKGSIWDSSTGNYIVTCTNGTIDKEGNVTYFEQ